MRLPTETAPAAKATRSKDSLGCSSGRLAKDQEITRGGTTFYRKRSDDPTLGQVLTPASDRGYLLGISMGPGHRRRILHDGRASTHEFDAGAVYVRDFAEDYRADLETPFDFLLMEMSRASFERATDERPGVRVRSLECVTALRDPVLSNLALALACALERPQETSTLFVDQMSVVIGTYLIEQYGGRVPAQQPSGRRLSRLHEARAKELLRSKIDGAVSIGEVADACNLSRSYFIRAFRETTGSTPLQWVLSQRLSVARGLLLDSQLTLAEIAATCGFADQSHFTRVFTQAEGQPPGNWRRQTRTPDAL